MRCDFPMPFYFLSSGELRTDFSEAEIPAIISAIPPPTVRGLPKISRKIGSQYSHSLRHDCRGKINRGSAAA